MHWLSAELRLMELTRWKQQWLPYEFMDGMIHEDRHMISIHFQDRTYSVPKWVLKNNILGVVHVPLTNGHRGCLETHMGVSKGFMKNLQRICIGECGGVKHMPTLCDGIYSFCWPFFWQQ